MRVKHTAIPLLRTSPMFDSVEIIRDVDHAITRARSHGLSLSEVLEGHARERAPLLEYPAQDLQTDIDNGGHCYAGITIGCCSCRRTVHNPSYSGTPRSTTLVCPDCGYEVAEWRS